ncbi:MAG: hypothetical protein LBV74_18815 [Tannerella sp.]|jgi:hypothetical protein|nr:hypothetical protein [Tannerella sp.]
MKRSILFVFVITVGLIFHQGNALGKKKPPVDFWPVEAAVLQLVYEIRETRDDSLAILKNRQIEEALAQMLISPSAYKYPFDSLRMIGRIYAPRKKFRIFNWNHAKRDGTHQHFALIVLPGKKGQPNKVFRLTDMSDSIKRPDQQVLGAGEWFGALYYRIIPRRKGKDKKVYYTLLGLDMNNLQTKKKVIEILSFGENGELQLGAPVIELNDWIKHRVIFEFSAKQSMYLEYNRLKRRMEFDHLAPLMPYLVGEYEYYEPDLFRDGLKFRRGHWKHYKTIQKPPKNKTPGKRNLPKPPKLKPPKKQQQKTEENNTSDNAPAGI